MVCVLTWSNSVVSLFDYVAEVPFVLSLLCRLFESLLPSNAGDKASAESRVKELEEALASQRAESKKTLDATKDAAAVREKEYAGRLAGLA